MESIEKIEQEIPGKFRYVLKRDKERTGRFEVQVFEDSHETTNDNGEMVWSKMSTKNFPRWDFEHFIDLIKNEI